MMVYLFNYPSFKSQNKIKTSIIYTNSSGGIKLDRIPIAVSFFPQQPRIIICIRKWTFKQ